MSGVLVRGVDGVADDPADRVGVAAPAGESGCAAVAVVRVAGAATSEDPLHAASSATLSAAAA